MGSFFSSGEKSTKTKSTTDPYGNMPDWLKNAFQSDVEFRDDFLAQVSAEAEQMGTNPREVLGVSDAEWEALAGAGAATDQASQQTQDQYDRLAGIGSDLPGFNEVEGPAQGLGDIYQAGDWQDVEGPTTPFEAVEGPQAANFDELRSKYESEYTDDVVNTTLAGMERQAQREQLARDAKAAQVGGLSNTRAAVADAVAGNLTGMSMAEMEAKLRDQAFNTAAGYGLQEGQLSQDFGLSQSQFAAGQSEAQRAWDMAMSEFGLSQEQARMASELQKQGMSLDEAVAQASQGNIASQFAADQEAERRQYGLDQAGLDLNTVAAMSGLTQDEYLRQFGLANLEGGLAATDRELSQGQIDSDYTANQDALTWLGGMFTASQNKGATPVGGVSTGKNTEPTASPFSQALGAASSAASIYAAFSDERVKEDVTESGSALDKLEKLAAREYVYTDPAYGDTVKRTTGLMAQDVERAGIVGGTGEVNGVKTVNFYPLLATVVQAVNELREDRKPGAGLTA